MARLWHCALGTLDELCGQMYAQILGVTGTLESLGDYEKSIVKDHFGIKMQTLAPSVYGDSQLKFREVDDVYVESDAPLHQRQIKEEILRATREGRPVLVFFESEESLAAWRDSEYGKGIPKLASVTRTVTNVDHYIAQATRRGSVTLFTRVHGRGLDFVCHDKDVNDKGGVHVVQAFLSAEKSEEIQIRGRTARQGKKGTFALVVNLEELRKIFDLDSADVDAARAKSEVYKLLDMRRTQWFANQSETRTVEVRRAKAAHDLTSQFQDACKSYLQGSSPERLERVQSFLHAQNREVSGTCRLMCLADATGSMSKLWKGTKEQIREMLKRVADISNGQGELEINWVAYRDYDCADKLLESSGWSSDASDLLAFVKKIKCEGGFTGDEKEAIEHALAFCSKQEPLPSRVLLIGDCAPHKEKKDEKIEWNGGEHVMQTDFRAECSLLAANNIPVYTFLIGDNAEAAAAFTEIATSTGGIASKLTSAEVLVDAVCIQALEQMGGAEMAEKYKAKYLAFTS